MNGARVGRVRAPRVRVNVRERPTERDRLCEGAVLGPPRGDVKHGKSSWNSVFTPDGYDKTFGELQFHEQAAFSHRRAAILKFLDKVAPAASTE